jgi:hypothetical protein
MGIQTTNLLIMATTFWLIQSCVLLTVLYNLYMYFMQLSGDGMLMCHFTGFLLLRSLLILVVDTSFQLQLNLQRSLLIWLQLNQQNF